SVQQDRSPQSQTTNLTPLESIPRKTVTTHTNSQPSSSTGIACNCVEFRARVSSPNSHAQPIPSSRKNVVLAGVQESILRKNLAAAVSHCFTTHSVMYLVCILFAHARSHSANTSKNYTTDGDYASPYARIYMYITQTNPSVFFTSTISKIHSAPEKLSYPLSRLY
ncbi:hypothetical protein PSTT_13656, partial [Puccinia striiformis]